MPVTPDAPLSGSVFGIILHDVCEEIRLEQLRGLLDAKRIAPVFKHPTPEHVRFQNPPVVETVDPIRLSTGETVQPEVRYYDYGVVSVQIELPLRSDWRLLTKLASNWVPNPEV